MRRFVWAVALAATIVVALLGIGVLFSHEASASKEPPASRTVPVLWYNGDTTETAYLAVDEVALVLKPGVVADAALTKRAAAAIAGATGAFTDKDARAVIVRKSGIVKGAKTLALNIKPMLDEVKNVSPVFLLSTAGGGTRRLLSGDLIVFFDSAPDAAGLAAFEKANGLTFAGSAGSDAALKFHADSPSASLAIANRVKTGDSSVKWAYPVWKSAIHPMWVPNDPLFSSQWHLYNTGQNGARATNDINVRGAWDTVRGSGVTIGVVDGGVENTHPDLSARYRKDVGWDYVDGDSTPAPTDTDDDWEKHGTSVAGVAAATSNNGIGVSGVAPEAAITAYRMNSDVDDSGFAAAESRDLGAADPVDIKTNSWGTGAGSGLVALTPDAELAFQSGVTQGRAGRGIAYFFAAGNEGDITDANHDFNSNNSGWANNRFVTAVAASDAQGKRADYSSPGANVRVNAPSNGGGSSGDCVASTAVAKTSRPSTFAELYTLKDGFLAGSEAGRRLTAVYYRAGVRLVPALMLDGAARQAVATAIDAWRPIVRSLSSDGADVVTAAQVDALESMASKLEAIGDAETATAIRAEMAAASARSFVGRPARDLWAHYAGTSKLTPQTLISPSASGLPSIVTSDRQGGYGYNSGYSPDGDYTADFGGTSAATPEVAGVAALMLQANPLLSWRDVQQILMVSADQNDPGDSSWFRNGAGYHVSDVYGFGRVNASKAVEVARAWTPAAPETSFDAKVYPAASIPDDNGAGVSSVIDVPANFQVEWVDVYVDVPDHTYWADLQITLTSPNGTRSYLARKHDYTSGDTSRMTDFRFGSCQFLGEYSSGSWRLNVADLDAGGAGTLQSWRIVVHGSRTTGGVGDTSDSNLQAAPVLASPVLGTVDSGLDPIDGMTVHLEQGEQIDATLRGVAGTDFDVYLMDANATGLAAEHVLAAAARTAYPDTLKWVAPYSGDFRLAVHAYAGRGAYSLTYTVVKNIKVVRTTSYKATVRRSHGVAKLTYKGLVRNYWNSLLGGRKAYLQVSRTGSSWSTAKTVVSNSHGAISGQARFTSKRTYYVRWYLPQYGGYGSAVSSTTKVTVK